MDSLISTETLASELGAPDLRLLDASFFLPSDGREAVSEYELAHVPGAIFFDLEKIVDDNNPLPGMLPPADKFASQMQVLGISEEGPHRHIRQQPAPQRCPRLVDAEVLRCAPGRNSRWWTIQMDR